MSLLINLWMVWGLIFELFDDVGLGFSSFPFWEPWLLTVWFVIEIKQEKVVKMQQPGPMFPVMPSFPPTNITTEQIQKVFLIFFLHFRGSIKLRNCQFFWILRDFVWVFSGKIMDILFRAVFSHFMVWKCCEIIILKFGN